jgi:uncharacterized iron-regulated membrane protein
VRLRPLIVQIHLWLGLIAGAFIAVLAITGSIMAFETELERALHPHRSYVTPQGQRLSLAQIAAAVQRAYPNDTIGAFVVATRPNFSYEVGLQRADVFVNPYTGEILGEQTAPDWLNTVHQLHTHLLLPRRPGDVGGKITSGAAVVLLLMLLSGLYLWWPLKRVRVTWRGAAARMTWFDIHNVTGILALLFLLALTTTGLVVGFESVTTPLFYKMTGSQATPRPNLRVAPVPGATPIAPDSALVLARAALPGTAPFEINVPGPGEAYVVRARHPEDRTPGGRSLVVLNPYTGSILFAEGSRGAPAGTRLVTANRAIHTGDILGIPGKILVSLASLAALAQVLTGLTMWLKRRRPV